MSFEDRGAGVRRAKRAVATFAIGTAGALVFAAAGLPLPFLLGPMAACILAAMAQVPMQGPGWLGQMMRTILGVAVGSAITPALIGRLPDLAVSIALLVPYTALIALAGFPFFYRVCGFDRATAYYAAMPGGFQDMVIFGEEAGADMRALSLIHATRILVVVALMPMVLYFGFGETLTARPAQAARETPLSELALMVAAGIGGWQVAKRVGMFGASILGPMIATAALSLAGLITQRPPAEAIIAAQLFIGVSIGAKYTGLTLLELRRDVGVGAVFSIVLCALAALFAWASHVLSGAPGIDSLLAFSPGGQAEMAVLAVVAGADLAFVVAHHVVRISMVILIAPLVARWVAR